MVYEWPGNVRELENALEHAVVLSRGNVIDAASLPERITKRRKEPLVAERSYRNPTLEVIERAYIMWVLQARAATRPAPPKCSASIRRPSTASSAATRSRWK